MKRNQVDEKTSGRKEVGVKIQGRKKNKSDWGAGKKIQVDVKS